MLVLDEDDSVLVELEDRVDSEDRLLKLESEVDDELLNELKDEVDELESVD